MGSAPACAVPEVRRAPSRRTSTDILAISPRESCRVQLVRTDAMGVVRALIEVLLVHLDDAALPDVTGLGAASR